MHRTGIPMTRGKLPSDTELLVIKIKLLYPTSTELLQIVEKFPELEIEPLLAVPARKPVDVNFKVLLFAVNLSTMPAAVIKLFNSVIVGNL